MTDFLTELQDLFSKKEIPNIIKDFTKSSFFRDHYLIQTFEKIVKNKNGEKVEIQPSRFKKKSFQCNALKRQTQRLTDRLTELFVFIDFIT